MKRDEKINLVESILDDLQVDIEHNSDGYLIIYPSDLYRICDSYAKGVLDKAFTEIDEASTFMVVPASSGQYLSYIETEAVELILDNILNEEE